MRFSSSAAANAAAWGVVAALIGGAVVITDVLGFFGLALLGGMTWLVCLRAEMDQDTPTWGVAVFKARMGSQGLPPEQRAATLDERQTFVSPLRFYRWCGIVLVGVGAAGFIWQAVAGGHSLTSKAPYMATGGCGDECSHGPTARGSLTARTSIR